MSWSLTIPKQINMAAFEAELDAAKESPKADGRTKIGREQAGQVAAAKDALLELAVAAGAPAGTASGHVNSDLSGTISVSVTISAP